MKTSTYCSRKYTRTRIMALTISLTLLGPWATQSATAASSTAIFKNTFYRFYVTLPATWKGYSVINGKWRGYSAASLNAVTSGPMISLRNPLWTSSKPRQDIPIMIFSLHKWNALRNENFHVGAAPIPPTELARNEDFIFALPARYNYAFLPGYQEVEKILKGKPVGILPKVDSAKL